MICPWAVVVAWSICRHAGSFVIAGEIVRCSAGTLCKNEVLMQSALPELLPTLHVLILELSCVSGRRNKRFRLSVIVVSLTSLESSSALQPQINKREPSNDQVH